MRMGRTDGWIDGWMTDNSKEGEPIAVAVLRSLFVSPTVSYTHAISDIGIEVCFANKFVVSEL